MPGSNIMDLNGIWTNTQAEKHLISTSCNEHILENIKETIYSWSYRSEYDLEGIKNDLQDISDFVTTVNFNDKVGKDIRKSVDCVVYNEVYENLIPLIRGKFSKEDLYLYEKCISLCKQNVSPGQLGSSVYNSVPFITAIVELSVLDTHKSPLEKINCLCTTYDLIFAELKLALVTIISKYSERECDIPVINNEEVIPILTLVVIKSKLLYLSSNLFYIKFFADDILKENNHIRTIVETYEQVFTKIMVIQESSLDSDCDKTPTNLNVVETINIISSEGNTATGEPVTLKAEGKRRLISLITSATAEKDFIPLNVSKIFS